tara:strand:- start:275 stop:595 length:321 start_codon:yes stop_codon:yes gene_type:complete
MEQIISYLIPAACIAYITYIWTDTNAFYDYFSFSKIFRKIPIIKEYEKSEYQMEFPMFLKQKESFFSKLITCHICLTFWMSVLCFIPLNLNLFVLAYLSLILYNFL